MIQRILKYSYYLLFGLTPLLWASWNQELFEYNKMMFIYLMTIIVATLWLVKMIKTKTLILGKTPLDLPLLLFLLANIISTITSMDVHTSFWGYYSRSNGGLISTIAYLILYFAMVANFKKEDVIGFLKAALFGGGLVALYAVPEHFGFSPSCLLLHQGWNASCWVQDVQARVFATLGQPNWLAAYLGMLIFPSFYFLLSAKNKLSFLFYFFLTTIYYLAFTFTYSRGATLGLAAGLLVFLALPLFQIKPFRINFWLKEKLPVTLLLALLLLVPALVFGSAVSRFKLLSTYTVNKTAAQSTSSGTQLESGGTESGQIRLIVWQGAWEIFKHYPLFGSGVETFAYSYYQYRPVAHNLTSEWDFLYNKAHNEFLNILSTTGLFGFLSYMAIILSFIFWVVKFTMSKIQNTKTNFTFYLLPSTLLASYTSYLVQNFFGFSVVIIALFFFLFPGLAFLATGSAKPAYWPKKLAFLKIIPTALYKKSWIVRGVMAALVIIALLLVNTLFNMYSADRLYAKGLLASDLGDAAQSYNNLLDAVTLNPNEPLYKSELGFAAASASVALAEQDSTHSGVLKDQALIVTNQALTQSPHNLTLLRNAIRTYYMLSALDDSFTQKTLEGLDQATKMAPTDAKLLYNKALVLIDEKKDQEAAKILEKVLEHKPNYLEARKLLATVYKDLGKNDQAVLEMEKAAQLAPTDQEVLDKLKEWKNQ